jgi:hypothetical protein
MVFHAQKAIFFHIGKTAGTNVEQTLLPGKRDYRVFYEDIVFGLDNGVMTQHLDCDGMKEYVKKDVYDSYFKFTIVRNPWERLYSAYNYLKPQHEQLFGNFNNYIEHACQVISNGRANHTSHFNPQSYYTKDATFVGRFENLQEDFNEICRLIGFPLTVLPGRDAHALKDRKYQRHYDDKTRELVSKTYSQEINEFNYVF